MVPSTIASTGAPAPAKCGRKKVYADAAEKQRAYRDRIRAKELAKNKPEHELTVEERVVQICREHHDERGIYLTDAPRGMGKIIYSWELGNQVGVHDPASDISDRNQVRDEIGGSRVACEGAPPDGDGYENRGRSFAVRIYCNSLSDGATGERCELLYGHKNSHQHGDHKWTIKGIPAFGLIDRKVALMRDYQVYGSMRSPLEQRALTIIWLADRGIIVSDEELAEKWVN